MNSARPRSPRVLVVGLGGTIAMSGPAAAGVTPRLSAGELVDAVPGLGTAGIEIDPRNLCNRPGASLTLDDLRDLVRLAEAELAAGAAGVVVTQGTDTIEETAYVLDLVHRRPEPIVVTGAMRNPTLAGADGPANILAAVRVAASPEARGLGCLVVLADEIHSAARVRKTHTTSVAAFASPDGGPLGLIAEGAVHILQRPVRRRPPAAGIPAGAVPRVGLVVATLGDDLPVLAEPLEGLVVAGFGVGHVPASWVEGLQELARRIPVVLASRIGNGFVATRTYGFAGSESDLIGRGLMPAGSLDPYKARLLLQLALMRGETREQMAATLRPG